MDRWEVDPIRQAALEGRALVVVTRGDLAGRVREALAVTGRTEDLREVRLPGCGPALPVDGASRRLARDPGEIDEGWRSACRIATDPTLGRGLDALGDPCGDLTTLPVLTLEDALAPGRVVVLLACSVLRLDAQGVALPLLLLARKLACAPPGERHGPLLLIEDFDGEAMAPPVEAAGLSAESVRGHPGLASVGQPGRAPADPSERSEDAWRAIRTARDALLAVRRSRTTASISRDGRSVVVLDEVDELWPASGPYGRIVYEVMPDGRSRSVRGCNPLPGIEETARAVWDGGIVPLISAGWRGGGLGGCFPLKEIEGWLAHDAEADRDLGKGIDAPLQEAIGDHYLFEEIAWTVVCDPALAGRRRDFVLTWPVLGHLLLRDDVRSAVDAGGRMVPFLARLLACRPALVRRMVGLHELPLHRREGRYHDGFLREALACLGGYAPDRLPGAGDREGWAAMSYLATFVAGYAWEIPGHGAAGTRRLLLSLPGNTWKERFRSLGGRGDEAEWNDMSQALGRWLRALAGPDVTVLHAKRILLGHRGLSRVARAVRDWHDDRLLSGTSQGLPSHTSWPVPFTPFSNGPDLEARVLGSVRELVDEGAHGPDSDGLDGLSHCVGGYGRECEAGKSLILSIREAPGKGGRRLSTAELVPEEGGGYRIGARAYGLRQHRGHGNAAPPAEAVDTLRALRDALGAGEVAIDEAALAPRPGTQGDGGFEAAASLHPRWRRILPTEWAAHDVGGLAAAVRRLVEETPPARHGGAE